MRKLVALVFISYSSFVFAQSSKKFTGNKASVIASIDKHEKELIGLSDKIWAFAETALKETQSAKLLADYAEQQGFKVTRNVAGLSTGFIAEYGTGKPIIGVMGEFDALPGLSQKASPTRDPLVQDAAGHGCGHNMFGAASLGSALSIKELIATWQVKGHHSFLRNTGRRRCGGKNLYGKSRTLQ